MSGDEEWHTDGPVVVGKYTQTRQRWLRVKIVKPSHSRHYKKRPLPCTGDYTKTTIWELEKLGNRKQVLRKREERKKIRKGNTRRERKKKIES